MIYAQNLLHNILMFKLEKSFIRKVYLQNDGGLYKLTRVYILQSKSQNEQKHCISQQKIVI